MKYFFLFASLGLSGVLTAQKHWNTAARFDGNSYIASMEPVLNETRAKLTVEFWLKPDVDSSSYTVMGTKQLWILTQNGRIRLVANGGSSTFSKSRLKGNTWTHVAAVYDGGSSSGTVKIYLNGVLDSSESFTGSIYGQTDSFIIGKKYFGNLKGDIDEIRYWRVARTADQIQKNYRTHIAGYYLDDIYSYGELAYVQSFEKDMSDSGLYIPNGKIMGNVVGVPVGLSPSTTVMHNNSMYFTGTTFSWLQSVTAADPDVCFTGPFTFEAWIHPESFLDRMVIVDLTSGGGGFQLATIYDGKLNFTLPPQSATTAQGLLPNTWYHVAVSVDSTSETTQTARLYVNGKLANTSVHNTLSLNSGKLRIGASHSNDDYFVGYMDEVRISNFAKTEAEIREFMFQPLLNHNQPAAPRSTVSYSFDGGLYSSTGKGPRLENDNSTCRFSYYNDPGSPLFSLGSQHAKIMKEFTTVQHSVMIPVYGSTSGVITDTLTMDQALKIDPARFKVFLSLGHANMADLKLELIAPTGEIVQLINQYSGIPGKEMTLIIDSQQLNKLTNAAFIEPGPRTGFGSSFAAFNGKNSKGVWTLKVSDLKLANTGRLYSWGISVKGDPVPTTGVSDAEAAVFVVYPNPAASNGQFHIKSSTGISETTEVSLMDVNGRVIYYSSEVPKAGVLTVTPDVKPAAGYYFVRVVNSRGVYTLGLQIR